MMLDDTLVVFRKRAVDATTVKAPAQPEPKGRAKKAVAKPKPDDKELLAMLAEFEIAPIEWRAKAQKPAEAKLTQEAPKGEATEGKRDRGRRRRGAKPEPTAKAEEPQEVLVAPEPEPEPVPEAKPIIVTPADAPRVVVNAGVPCFYRQGRIYPAVAFFGNARDEQRARTVLDQIQMAAEAGVHIHSHMVEFEVDPGAVNSSVSMAAYLLAKTVELDPETQVILRLSFVPPAGFQNKYREAFAGPDQGPSLSDDAYWGVARDAVFEFCRQMRLLPHTDHILGIHLENGEWFVPESVGYDNSRAATQKFREWIKTRYRNDVVALQAAWFNGQVTFEDVKIPAQPDNESEADEKFVRANRRERQWVDYHLFLSDQTEARISDLAYAVKEASEGYYLVGASYGYTFEWSHPASGHLSLGKLLRSPEIDFIAGPPSYRNREPGGAASFPGPIDSFALNGKLYLSEEDFKTSIGLGYEPDDFNPVITTPQALESVHWRGVGSALAHGSGVCWMDLWGNGWLKTPSAWERAAQVRNALTLRLSRPPTDPDVAVFIDERSLAYLVDRKGFSMLVQNVRESVMRAGLSAAFYLLSDLQHREVFPESRLYVFLNAWDVRAELRAAIKSRLQRDDKVLFWLYTAGLFDSGRESLERAREVTGIALRPQPYHSRTGTTILNRRHPLCEAFADKNMVGGTRLEPSYFAIPEDATVLGEYTQTGLPSFVLREFRNEKDQSQNWQSVFLGEPIVSPTLIRALGQMAGAHVWSFSDDVIHARPPFFTVHCKGTGTRTIALPAKWSAFDLVEEEWIPTEGTSLRFNAIDGETRCFLVGVREELEHMLSLSPDDLLKLDELPQTETNTIRFDAATFDVPIVRLDEWMDSGEGEGIAEELLFKPRLLEEDEEEDEPQSVGRRRRKRTRRRDNDRGGPVAGEPDLGLGVVFRKRE